jgi:type I restriction enzyme S subunit
MRQKQIDVLDNLIKARFVELFGDPMINNKGFELRKYGELFELNAGGTPSKAKPEYWNGGNISWIGSNMCQNAYIYENDGNYITEEGMAHSSARMFPVDTVLVALVGATIGKTALLKFETTTNQNVLGIRKIRENGYLPEFIFYYTQGLYQKFLNIGDGGFAMASKGFISELPLPVVDIHLQEEFSMFAEQVDKSKVVVQKSLDETQKLFDSLMQEYFG